MLKEQELYNKLRAKDYGPAIGLALELKRPQRLWSVLRDAMTEGMGEKTPGDGDGEVEIKIRIRRACVFGSILFHSGAMFQNRYSFFSALVVHHREQPDRNGA